MSVENSAGTGRDGEAEPYSVIVGTRALTIQLVLVERSAVLTKQLVKMEFLSREIGGAKKTLELELWTHCFIYNLFVKGNRRSKNDVSFGTVEVCLAKEI